MVEGRAASARRVVEFINTLHRPDGDDVLADRRGSVWLAEWLGIDVPGGADGIDRDAWADLPVLREGLRELAAANNGIQPDARIVARAATVAGSVRLAVELGDHLLAPRLVAPAGAGAADLGMVSMVESFVTIRATDDWSRVKVCAAPNCRWAYLDNSRNRSRRWCDMADCGNRAKNQTWRERHRAAGDRKPAEGSDAAPVP